jgi:hypothetical protein
MNRRLLLPMLAVAVAVSQPSSHADEIKAVLDTAANDRVFDTHFTRFGPSAARVVVRDGKGVRFRLPPKSSGHNGLYSYVVLAGDFEISARFEWPGVPVPKTGYGASAGLTVDAGAKAGSLSFGRANLPKVGGSYVMIRGIPGKSGVDYETVFERTRATSGRIVLRREKQELICEIAEDAKTDSRRELRRFPFTGATVNQVRIYGDAGGIDAELDARIYDLKVVAEEITAGVPERDRRQGFPWTLLLAFVVVVITITVWRSKANS